jgi:hypothetical protein
MVLLPGCGCCGASPPPPIDPACPSLCLWTMDLTSPAGVLRTLGPGGDYAATTDNSAYDCCNIGIQGQNHRAEALFYGGGGYDFECSVQNECASAGVSSPTKVLVYYDPPPNPTTFVGTSRIDKTAQVFISAYCSYGCLFIRASRYEACCGHTKFGGSGSDVQPALAYYTGTVYDGTRDRLSAIAVSGSGGSAYAESVCVPSDATQIVIETTSDGVSVTAGDQSAFHEWVEIGSYFSEAGDTAEYVLENELYPEERIPADTTHEKWSFPAVSDYPTLTLNKRSECGLNPTISVDVCGVTVSCDPDTEHLIYDNGYPVGTPFYGLGVNFGEICDYTEDDTNDSFCYEGGETTYSIAKVVAFISDVSVLACSEANSVPILTFSVYLLAFIRAADQPSGEYLTADWRSWFVTARGCDPTIVVTPYNTGTPACEGLGLCWPSPLPDVTVTYAPA